MKDRPMILTPESLLDLMKPGRLYISHNLAQRRKTTSAEVVAMLLDLVKAGKVSIVRVAGRKNRHFILAGTEHLRKQSPEKPEVDRSTLALPRTPPPLTQNLVGYQREINQRAELAMMARHP